MHTRKIALTDAFYIAALSDQLGYAMSVENTAKQINAINKSTIDAAYVAVDDSKVIGWIHVFYTVRLESAPFCEIAGLVVGEGREDVDLGEAQGEGIAGVEGAETDTEAGSFAEQGVVGSDARIVAHP